MGLRGLSAGHRQAEGGRRRLGLAHQPPVLELQGRCGAGDDRAEGLRMSTDREIGMRQLQAHLFTQFVHERCSWFVEGAQAQSSRIDVRPPVLPPCSPPAGGSCRLGLTL